jgi:O-glycosyl hydrolase
MVNDMLEKFRSLTFYFLFCIFFASCQTKERPVVLERQVSVDASTTYQTIDGFGVNINPAQWRGGNLKDAVDILVDDLGASLFRFDCVGFANWLDPTRRNDDGKYPDDYLTSVYTNKTFRDAWETFRYLNIKGIVPFFNVSGKIDRGLAASDRPRFLEDFDGYAEMVVTMIQWAREKEKLNFTLLDPCNETDLGYRDWMPAEGPGLDTKDLLPLTHIIADKLTEYGLDNIELMVMSDSDPTIERTSVFLEDSSLHNKVTHFGFHIYGGYPGVPQALVDTIDKSVYKGSRTWMTEYGDLDLSGLVEYRVAWRSTNMLIDFINDGFNGGMVWDAFDNYHKHDEAWSQFGLLKTDTTDWSYSPKLRYYAAKQVHRFVRPGFERIETNAIPLSNGYDVYEDLKNPFKYIKLMSFTSPDKKDFTIVGTSVIEGDVELTFDLKGFGKSISGKKVYVYRTSETEHCHASEEIEVINNQVKVLLKENGIVTISTIGI